MRKIILAIVLAVLVYLVYYVFFENNYNNWPIVNAKPQGETIVAFGDSLTAGYGVDKKIIIHHNLPKCLISQLLIWVYLVKQLNKLY